MDKYRVLKKYFGHSQFRQGQETLIDAILEGRDALGIMPTGGGKSVCYQVPAMLLPGLTLVISPLISLMADQVMALTRAGIPAVYINSSLDYEEVRQIGGDLRRGQYKLLYVAPERFESRSFVALMQQLPVSLVAVDEAHCISQWGQDFRPSYLRIYDFISGLPRRPVISAFTATATSRVRQDIVRLLRLNDPVTQVTGFDRPNLYFDIRHPGDKAGTLLKLVRAREGKSGIVYCSTRSKVEKVCHMLCEAGIDATRYHAGLDEAERRQNQNDFQFDRKTVMVATNAFGMGIDKSNVSFVIHFNMPKSIEAYYQEAGRAGRDGQPADCIMLYDAGDIETAKYFIEADSGNDAMTQVQQAVVKQQDYDRLRAMIGVCRTTKCFRGCILDYFGQSHPVSCGNCGNCKSEYEVQDITVQAQMILSCILRIKEKLGYYVGRPVIVQTLRGSKNKRLRELKLDGVSTYGLMSRCSADEIRSYMDWLEQEGYIVVDMEHSALGVTQKAAEVLFKGKKLEMMVRKSLRVGGEEKPKKKKQETADLRAAADDTGELYNVLRRTRTKLAQEENVPAYVIFSNATLTEMAEIKPRTMAELMNVSGVGSVKAMRYGKEFLRAISDFGA